ncbi:MAG: autotransporter domain-containing protein [Akkermansia sp.]|nr:autotransporter domain-containing protein [Akkermansia sp.]
MKLHLPTKLRAAVIAAMALLTAAPTAFAIDFDPSAAVYDTLLMGSADSVTIPSTIEPKENYHDYTLSLPTGLEQMEGWTMVIQSEGWNTISDQLIFAWDDSNVMFGAGNKNWLTYSGLNHGFALMMSSGRLLMITSADGDSFNNLITKYNEDASLLTGLGKQKDVSVEMTLSYDAAQKTLTVQSGTLTYGDTTKEIEQHSFANVELADTTPGSNYTNVGGSQLNHGATTTVTTILPGNETAWNISGITSLDGLEDGNYMDVVSEGTPKPRPMTAMDGLYFVGNSGVLYAESDNVVSNKLGTALIRETPTISSSIGLGAAEGTKLTILRGDTALGQGNGLRVIGDGEVELQTSYAATTVTQLSLADSATLTITGDNAQVFNVSADRISSTSSLSVENGVNLVITDGSDVRMKSLTALDGYSNIYGTGSYTVEKLTIGGTTANIGYTNKDAVAVRAGHVEVSAENFNILDGNSLRADTATFSGMNVTVMDKMSIGSVTSDAVVTVMNPANWAMPVTFDKVGDDSYTVTGLTMDAATGTAEATTLDKAVAKVAKGGRLTVGSATDSTFANGSATSLAATQLTDGLLMSSDAATSAASIKAGTMALNDSTLGGQDSASVSAVTLNDGATLTMKKQATLSTGSLTGTDSTSVDMSGSTALTAETLEIGNLTLSGEALAIVNEITLAKLAMSGDSHVITHAMHLTEGEISIPTEMYSLPTTTFSDVDITDGTLGTTKGIVGGITGNSVSIGTGYTLIGQTMDEGPALVNVTQLDLADNAAMENIAVGLGTAVNAEGTQQFTGVQFAGGYDKMSFDGGTTTYIALPTDGTLAHGSILDSLGITGTATADTLSVNFLEINGEGLYFGEGGESYTILTTGDGVALTFDTDDLSNRQYNIKPYTYAELSVEPDGSGQALVIHGREAKEEIMAPMRDTANRTAAMDSLAKAADAGTTTAVLHDIYKYLGDVYHPTLEQRQTALSALSGASLTALADTQRRGIEDMQKNLRNRVIQMGGQEDGLLHGWEKGNVQAWAQADGAYHTLSQSGDKAGYNYDVWGATVGINADLNDHWTVGGAFAAEFGSIDGKSVDKFEADTESIYLNLFARYQKGHWTQLGIFTYGQNDTDTTRSFMGYEAEGSTSGNSFSGYYELGYLIPMDDEVRQLIQPIFNVSITSAKTDGFTESGSIGNAGLKYDSQSFVYGSVGVGARYQAVLAQSVYERNTVLELRGQINQHFGDSTDEASVSYIGGGAPFTVHGAESGDFGVQMGAGIAIPLYNQTTVFGDVDGEFRSKQTDFRANIGVRYEF